MEGWCDRPGPVFAYCILGALCLGGGLLLPASPLPVHSTAPVEGNALWDRAVAVDQEADVEHLSQGAVETPPLAEIVTNATDVHHSWELYARGRNLCLSGPQRTTIEPDLSSYSRRMFDDRVWIKKEDRNRQRKPFSQDELKQLRLTSCTWEQPEGPGSPDSTWHFHRLGPFVTHGGGTWVQFDIDDVMDLSRSEGTLHIGAIVLAPVARHGEPLGYPPIHIHHWHLAPAWSFNYTAMHTVFAQAHGDSQCRREHGGARCLFQSVPEGMSLGTLASAGGGFNTDGDLIDERPPNSPPLTFFAEIALQTFAKPAGAPDSTLNLLSIGNPFRFDLARASMEMSLAQLYFLPSSREFDVKKGLPEVDANAGAIGDTEHVLWFSSRFLASGTYVWAYLHTHQEWMDEVLVIFADPRTLGLNQPPFQLEKPWEPLALRTLQLNKDGFIHHMHTTMRDAKLEPRDVIKCHYKPNLEKDRGRRLVGCIGLDGCSRLPLKFARGDVLTVVAFGDNRDSEEAAMHTIFRGLVHYDEDQPVPIDAQRLNGLYVFGTSDPNYQLQHDGFLGGRDQTVTVGGSPLSAAVRAINSSLDYSTALAKMYNMPPRGEFFSPLEPIQ